MPQQNGAPNGVNIHALDERDHLSKTLSRSRATGVLDHLYAADRAHRKAMRAVKKARRQTLRAIEQTELLLRAT
jgi:hypothetical protein